MATEERIETLHPEGKKGVNILKRRYDLVKDWILETLQQKGALPFETLTDLSVEELTARLDGKVLWYLVTVKQDLEARELIERVPKKKPQHLRIKQQ